MIVDSKGELPVAAPHVSDEEDDGKPFGGAALREQKAISFSISVRTENMQIILLQDQNTLRITVSFCVPLRKRRFARRCEVMPASLRSSLCRRDASTGRRSV